MEIFYITSNKGKFTEAKEIIPELKMLPADLDEIQSLDPVEVIRKKVDEAYRITGAENLVVDDVSVYLEAFNYKLPGPLVKWFLVSISSGGIFDMASFSGKYGAKVICTLCYRNKEGEIKVFSGKVNGTLVKPRSNSLKSWDGAFQPDGEKVTFADMDLHRKNLISHRGIAIRKLKKYLES